jgi:hypothetical protein
VLAYREQTTDIEMGRAPFLVLALVEWLGGNVRDEMAIGDGNALPSDASAHDALAPFFRLGVSSNALCCIRLVLGSENVVVSFTRDRGPVSHYHHTAYILSIY